MKKKHVAVMMGGVSPEHLVSIRSGSTVVSSLSPAKYNVLPVIIQQNGLWLIAENLTGEDELLKLSGTDGLRPEIALAKLVAWGIDIAFLALHGPNGEDGSIQGFFQASGIPYTGSGVETCATSMNKYTSKLLAGRTGVLVPQGLLISREDWSGKKESILRGIENKIGFPGFVKPLRLGSSIGMYKVMNREELGKALAGGLSFDDDILYEKEIMGREITCAVLGNADSYRIKVLPPVEIRPKNRSFFDFESKYDAKKADEICPAQLSRSLLLMINNTAEKICIRFKTRGLCRIDFILNDAGLWFLELNAIPGLTRESLVIKEAKAAGITLGELMDLLIQGAFQPKESDVASRE